MNFRKGRPNRPYVLPLFLDLRRGRIRHIPEGRKMTQLPRGFIAVGELEDYVVVHIELFGKTFINLHRARDIGYVYGQLLMP